MKPTLLHVATILALTVGLLGTVVSSAQASLLPDGVSTPTSPSLWLAQADDDEEETDYGADDAPSCMPDLPPGAPPPPSDVPTVCDPPDESEEDY